MTKKLNLMIAILVIALIAMPSLASADSDAGGFGTTLTVNAADFDGLSADASVTPSNGVRLAYTVDASLQFFAVASQHQRGDSQYGMHSNGGTVFERTVTTMGTWEANPLPDDPTADPATDFSSWSGGAS